MAIVKGVCSICGEIVDCDDTKEAIICPKCNNPFVTEKAIRNYKKMQEEQRKLEDTSDDFVIQKGILINYCGVETNVVIPDDVVIIGEAALANNPSLKGVTIPNSVTRISDKAFYNCSSLKAVEIPETVISVGDNVFEGCSSLADVVLHVGLTSLGDSCFSNCKNLTTIAIPESVNYIGKFAFSGCTNLNHVDIHSRTKIDHGAFDLCPCLNKESEKTIRKFKKGCYIATCVYGSYDCPEVWTLRRYRDYTLGKSWYGRLFIKVYYRLSPKVVELFGDKLWFRDFWKSTLDRKVQRLNMQGIDDKEYNDIDW